MIPSPYESLSVITLEAWKLGVPVLANAQCRVLAGQCRRSNGGLFYEGYAEFAEALELLLRRPEVGGVLGRQGRAYVEAEYSWERVEAKLEDLFARLGATARSMLLVIVELGRRRIRTPCTKRVFVSVRNGHGDGLATPLWALAGDIEMEMRPCAGTRVPAARDQRAPPDPVSGGHLDTSAGEVVVAAEGPVGMPHEQEVLLTSSAISIGEASLRLDDNSCTGRVDGGPDLGLEVIGEFGVPSVTPGSGISLEDRDRSPVLKGKEVVGWDWCRKGQKDQQRPAHWTSSGLCPTPKTPRAAGS